MRNSPWLLSAEKTPRRFERFPPPVLRWPAQAPGSADPSNDGLLRALARQILLKITPPDLLALVAEIGADERRRDQDPGPRRIDGGESRDDRRAGQRHPGRKLGRTRHCLCNGERHATEWPSRRLYIFRPGSATRCHKTKASLVLVSQRRSVRGDYDRDRGGTVRKVFVTLNPDKLAHLRAPQGVSKY